MKRYLFNLLIGIDQFCNTVLGGDPDETISSRVGKYARSGPGWIPCQLCKFLNLFEKDHCVRSIEEDEGNNSLTKF
jgi:hypothetical protein